LRQQVNERVESRAVALQPGGRNVIARLKQYGTFGPFGVRIVLWARCRLISAAEGQEMEDKPLGSPSPEIYQITHLGSEKEICRMWLAKNRKV
jgi:hypothetical protein